LKAIVEANPTATMDEVRAELARRMGTARSASFSTGAERISLQPRVATASMRCCGFGWVARSEKGPRSKAPWAKGVALLTSWLG
jgi:hypothetical protein